MPTPPIAAQLHFVYYQLEKFERSLKDLRVYYQDFRSKKDLEKQLEDILPKLKNARDKFRIGMDSLTK